MDLSILEGEFLVELARKSISYYLKNLVPMKAPKIGYPKLKQKRGVFCTLLTYPDNNLRGCIGIVFPNGDLIETTIEASCSAAQDPRFLPLKEEELNKIVIQLSILSDLERILVYEPRDYLNEIKLGEDGLYLKYKFYSALFLPQVPVEQDWDIKTYLSQLCIKAGLREDAWINKPIKLYKFKTQVFAETEPNGKVYEVKKFLNK
jgi:hypothetical protein